MNWKANDQDMSLLKELADKVKEDPAWMDRLVEHVQDMCHEAYTQALEDYDVGDYQL